MPATDINSCTFTGNVVKDPYVQAYGDDKKLARIRLAVNNYGDKVAWIDLTVFGALAEKVVIPMVKKGTGIAVTARVETRDMDGLKDAEGNEAKRTAVGFVVSDLKLVGAKPNGNGSENPAPAPDAEPPPF